MRVLVVGTGFMGTLHAQAVQGSRFGTLGGIVDANPETARSVGHQLGVPFFTEIDEAIGSVQPEAAIISTPDNAHREPAEVLIKSGVHLLIEKPLATNSIDAEAIERHAEQHDVRVMPGHITRFYPRYTQVREEIKSGAYGKPVLVTTSTWGPKSVGERVRNTTNPIWHFAIHDIDLIQWICASTISERCAAQMTGSNDDISAFMAMGYLTDGTAFNAVTGWTLPDTAAPSWDLKVHCEHGVIQATWSDDGVMAYTADSRRNLDCLAWPTMHGITDGALRREVDHFLTSLQDSTPFAVTTSSALRAVRSAEMLETRCRDQLHVSKICPAERTADASPTRDLA